ncbi:MAG TPA: methylated-DNA--[protein]-cysteine S-methyltransferase [Candidatus Dormibacteraeota bacterium]
MPRTDPLYSTVHRTPVGALTLIASDRGLRTILWENTTALQAGITTPPKRSANHPILRQTATQMDEYFAGTRTAFDIPLDLEGTRFQLAAWHALAEIPFGATTTYGKQARAIGVPTAARAIGAANGANPVCIVLPCHRVIGANGSLTGFGGGLAIKQWLLDHEARVAATHSTSSPRLRGEGQGEGPATVEGWPSRHPTQQRLSMPVA